MVIMNFVWGTGDFHVNEWRKTHVSHSVVRKLVFFSHIRAQNEKTCCFFHILLRIYCSKSSSQFTSFSIVTFCLSYKHAQINYDSFFHSLNNFSWSFECIFHAYNATNRSFSGISTILTLKVLYGLICEIALTHKRYKDR